MYNVGMGAATRLFFPEKHWAKGVSKLLSKSFAHAQDKKCIQLALSSVLYVIAGNGMRMM